MSFLEIRLRVYNSYSEVMFSPEKLRRVVAELAAQLPNLRDVFDFGTIVVTGKSEAAVGFALSMVADINVVFVRKGESTHGDMIEGPDRHAFNRYAFFDDFVASGRTRQRVQDELTAYALSRDMPAPERVLTIEYQTSDRAMSEIVTRCGDPVFNVAAAYHLPERLISIH